MELSVVIVNFNVKYFLEQCLLSLEKASAGLEVEVWVVDNHSSDGSVDFLRSRFPRVRFTENDVNEGFSRANNQVIPQLRGEFVLFLNPDTLIPEDCFRACISFLRQHDDAGGLGVRMIDGAGCFLPESKRSFPSPLGAFFKVTGIHHLFPASKFFSSYYSVNVEETGVGETDVLSGAFFMMRRTVLNETGGFDTDYFMYGEDIDLSYRLQKAGYHNYYYGNCTILHFKGESTQKQSRAHVHHFYGAMSLFVQKHYSGLSLLMMKAGISFSKTLAYISLALMPGGRKAGMHANRNIFFIGSEQQYSDCKKLILHSDPSAVFAGRDNGLPPAGIPNKVNSVLLHEGMLGFKDIISLFEQLPKKTERLVRADGSRSVTGSGQKNERGIVMHD